MWEKWHLADIQYNYSAVVDSQWKIAHFLKMWQGITLHFLNDPQPESHWHVTVLRECVWITCSVSDRCVFFRHSVAIVNERSENTHLCGCGCALLNEPCPCWHSCSSCTCISRRRSSPSRPSVRPSHPPLTGSPPQTEGPHHSAHSWGQLKPNTQWLRLYSLKMYCCII